MIDTFGRCTSLSIPFSHVDMCYVVTTVFLFFVCILLSVFLHACMSTTLAVLTFASASSLLIFEIPPSHINRFCMATFTRGLDTQTSFSVFFFFFFVFAFLLLFASAPSCLPA